jgi:hypothetical protein
MTESTQPPLVTLSDPEQVCQTSAAILESPNAQKILDAYNAANQFAGPITLDELGQIEGGAYFIKEDRMRFLASHILALGDFALEHTQIELPLAAVGELAKLIKETAQKLSDACIQHLNERYPEAIEVSVLDFPTALALVKKMEPRDAQQKFGEWSLSPITLLNRMIREKINEGDIETALEWIDEYCSLPDTEDNEWTSFRADLELEKAFEMGLEKGGDVHLSAAVRLSATGSIYSLIERGEAELALQIYSEVFTDKSDFDKSNILAGLGRKFPELLEKIKEELWKLDRRSSRDDLFTLARQENDSDTMLKMREEEQDERVKQMYAKAAIGALVGAEKRVKAFLLNRRMGFYTFKEFTELLDREKFAKYTQKAMDDKDARRAVALAQNGTFNRESYDLTEAGFTPEEVYAITNARHERSTTRAGLAMDYVEKGLTEEALELLEKEAQSEAPVKKDRERRPVILEMRAYLAIAEKLNKPELALKARKAYQRLGSHNSGTSRMLAGILEGEAEVGSTAKALMSARNIGEEENRLRALTNIAGVMVAKGEDVSSVVDEIIEQSSNGQRGFRGERSLNRLKSLARLDKKVPGNEKAQEALASEKEKILSEDGGPHRQLQVAYICSDRFAG